MQFSPIFSTQAERTTGTISPNLFPWFLVDKTPFSLVKLESSVADKFSVYQLYYLNIYIHIPIVSLSYHLYLTNHQEQHDILYVLTGWYHIKIYIIKISSTYHTYIYIYLDLYLYLYLYLYPYLYLYLSIQKYIYHLWWEISISDASCLLFHHHPRRSSHRPWASDAAPELGCGPCAENLHVKRKTETPGEKLGESSKLRGKTMENPWKKTGKTGMFLFSSRSMSDIIRIRIKIPVLAIISWWNEKNRTHHKVPNKVFVHSLMGCECLFAARNSRF